jgi:NAD kinase
LSNDEVLKKFGAGGYRVDEIEKLEVHAKEKILRGINDIIVHNDNPRHAIRYHLFVNDKQMGGEIIGDGVIVATPLGSTGYYRSITGSFFELGIGVAFNNSTEQADHMVLREDAIVRVGITRGPAFVYADNQKEAIPLADGDEVTVQKSSAVARIIRVV